MNCTSSNLAPELRGAIARLVKPELEAACSGSLHDEKDRTRFSQKLLALELRPKISRTDVKDLRNLRFHIYAALYMNIRMDLSKKILGDKVKTYLEKMQLAIRLASPNS